MADGGKVAWKKLSEAVDLKGRSRTRDGHHISWELIGRGRRKLCSTHGDLRVSGTKSQIVAALRDHRKLTITVEVGYNPKMYMYWEEPKQKQTGTRLSRTTASLFGVGAPGGLMDSARKLKSQVKALHGGKRLHLFVTSKTRRTDGLTIRAKELTGPDLAGHATGLLGIGGSGSGSSSSASESSSYSYSSSASYSPHSGSSSSSDF